MIEIPETIYAKKIRRKYRLSLSEAVLSGLAGLDAALAAQIRLLPLSGHGHGHRYQPSHAWEIALYNGLQHLGFLPGQNGEADVEPTPPQTRDHLPDFLDRLDGLIRESRSDHE